MENIKYIFPLFFSPIASVPARQTNRI